ncbi:MAG: nucleotidyltransferase family protein [Bacteroidales bacterium]|nr:nucleotidyltransferase family protein [Bacteroidales bacterium]
MKRSISAMLFAAGLGTRLYPLTADKPKALVEYQGKPLIDYVLHKIIDSGIQHIVVNVHHFPDLIIRYLKEHPYHAEIEISDERDYLRDTGGGLKFAAPLLADSEHILLHNVDILSDLDLRQLIAYHVKHEALATLAVRQRETSRYFLFDGDMNLCGWRNSKTGEEIRSKVAETYTPFAFSGIHIVRRELINLIPSTEKQSITPIYIELARNHKLKGFLHNEGHWKDMGKIEDFNS